MKKILSVIICASLFVIQFAEAQSYKSLHKKSIVIDTHNDFISTGIEKNKSFDQDLKGITHSDLNRMKKGGVDVQIFSIFCDENYGMGTAFAYANREIDSLYAVVERNPKKMMIVRNPADLELAVKSKKLGSMLGIEGGHMIEDRIDYLDSLYKRGGRYMTLTWNNSTSWASSAADERAGKDLGHPYGLNELGEKIVRHMNELGMIVDISHVGEKTFYDALRITTKPVIASHSCAYSICPVPRNMTDDQIRMIKKTTAQSSLTFIPDLLIAHFVKRTTTSSQNTSKKRIPS